MSKYSFLNHTEPLLTVMVQGDTPAHVEGLIERALPVGAEAFGMQLCVMKPEYRTPEVYRRLFEKAQRPVYVTNYRGKENEGKSDEQLAAELLELAECGATLCDVMGDYFAPCKGEVIDDPVAIQKQEALIDAIHQRGAEAVISSHILKYTAPERVLEIALEYQRRGADVCKLVTGAETMEEQLENLKTVDLLRRNLKIPFLFLSSGENRLLRRVGGTLGCCMYLSVLEYDQFATKAQPLLSDLVKIRELLK